MNDASPLRYPGGKWRLTSFFSKLIATNFDTPPPYMEPYVGGGSLALSLLYCGVVSEVFLNDLDPAIYAFWTSVLHRTKAFLELLSRTPVTPKEWDKQKQIYTDRFRADVLHLGFATFFLNRTNHSGILNGGMIGGRKQNGGWKIDARYNNTGLAKRIERIASHKHQIHISNLDACTFLRRYNARDRFFYLDPPYYHAGKRLYLNHYRSEDHEKVCDAVEELESFWVVSYDDAPEIHKLYEKYRRRNIHLLHTARSARLGREVIFFSPELHIPRQRAQSKMLL